jgi:two-component system CheB/CheR fusion protein
MSASPVQALRVLVVDDCPDTRWSLAALLRIWGHDTRVAGDGPSALQVAATYHPEVILLDVGLPGMDGYEVARRFRRMAGGGRPLIVTLSGYGQESDRRHSLEAGCDQHLVKPVDPDVLSRLLASRPVTAVPSS